MQKPVILFENKYSESDLKIFKNKYKIEKVVDIFVDQLEEFFQAKNPSVQDKESIKKFISGKVGKNADLAGNWVYFPWSKTLVHTVSGNDYFALRTNRNKNLIREDEQRRLYESCVGIVGLSVGATVALNLVYSGIARTLKLAEHDTLATTNLNRLQARLEDIGRPKIELLAERIYEVNPYQNIVDFPFGLTAKNLIEFLVKEPKPAVIFEAIDDFEMKIRLRQLAKKERVPVIMLTNLGDNVLVDVERYDLDPKAEFFNGLIGEVPEKILNNAIGDADKIKYAMELVGVEHVPTRALESLLEIRKTLVGRPQLASTVSAGGGLGTYLARRILLSQELPSGRTYVSFESLFEMKDKSENKYRKSLIKKIYARINKDDTHKL